VAVLGDATGRGSRQASRFIASTRVPLAMIVAGGILLAIGL